MRLGHNRYNRIPDDDNQTAVATDDDTHINIPIHNEFDDIQFNENADTNITETMNDANNNNNNITTDLPDTTSPIVPSLPRNPPIYQSHSFINNYPRNENRLFEGSSSTMEQMSVEEPILNQKTTIREKLILARDSFTEAVIIPFKQKIYYPVTLIFTILSERLNYYLGKIGNPFILKRFFYIVLMTVILYLIRSSGLLYTHHAYAIRGMFSEQSILVKYMQTTVDFNKFERDLEYLSSMQHMTGTKGDMALVNYIQQSFSNNGLKLLKENTYSTYSTYPNINDTFLRAVSDDGKTIMDFDLTIDNFQSMSINGELSKTPILYGYKGRYQDLAALQDSNIISQDQDYMLLLEYDDDILVSEQILMAQKFNSKAVIFISNEINGDKDIIKLRSVSFPQFSMGDPLTPGWHGDTNPLIFANESLALQSILTLPISFNDGEKLLSHLSKDNINFENNKYSGKIGDLYIDLKINNTIRERHPTFDIIGKIEGKEQSDKAVAIVAGRNSISFGAQYPNMGTSALLTIVELMQRVHFEYNWKPLRNIYFISFGGDEFNYAGATELLEERLKPFKDEVYSIIDISQIGFDSNVLSVQTHPLLKNLFQNLNDRDLHIDISHVKQYGNWIPFMANGIPVSVLSNPNVLKRKGYIDTSKDTFENLHELLVKDENRKILQNIFTFIFDTILRLSDDPVIPFDITNYANTLSELLHDLEKQYSGRLNFDSVIKGLLSWKSIGVDSQQWFMTWSNIVLAHNGGLEPSLLSVNRWTWNRKYSNIGRRQCIPEGIPNRPFYKNVLLGSSFWQSSDKMEDHWSFPGVRDAINENDFEKAQRQLDIAGESLQSSAALFIEETNDVGFK
ncbi:hypothetical protein TBLA_0B03690 [Henningerozyma blattae CBS 6284]|uniref:Uncharacterized protein n=1 Tax=Henningerozyma blattae (strain ATCC 34711 / CBS 6284 / DSM 70876 / NBRC 10599 / NRRL Y-10934 / UCD 77-7) TaxID=1071380 RepID=I2GYK6_HENB6|nr:hypothetical protein TBLA_0B03690 [Tetrapisispora blattae CBS 6284]CCH59208.1 hypothetical protein TBLA_0B03690 [Tetrapisispora blattae CBS 6284]